MKILSNLTDLAYGRVDVHDARGPEHFRSSDSVNHLGPYVPCVRVPQSRMFPLHCMEIVTSLIDVSHFELRAGGRVAFMTVQMV